MKKIIALIISFILISSSVCFADAEYENIDLRDYMEALSFTGSNGLTLPYRLYVPDSYDENKEYALLLYFHGAGRWGDDNYQHIINGGPHIMQRIVNDQYLKDECIIIAPQSPENQKWVNTDWTLGTYDYAAVGKSERMVVAEEIVYKTIKDYSIDTDRLYVSGASMGGYGTWNIIMHNPDLFAAAIPLCGAADPAAASSLMHMPIWAFHGGADDVVPVSGSRVMVKALQKAGSHNIKYTEYPGIGHSINSIAYSEPELLKWLFSQKKNHGVSVDYDGTQIKLISDTDRTANIVAAAYDKSGKLLDIFASGNVSITANKVSYYDVWNLNTVNASRISVMVLSDYNSIMPLTDGSSYNNYRFSVDKTGNVSVKAVSDGIPFSMTGITVRDESGKLVYINQQQTDWNGAYSFSFKIKDYSATKKYTVKIGTQNCEIRSYDFDIK